MDDLTAGMIEIRHAGFETPAAYDALYAAQGIRRREAFVRWLLDLMGVRGGASLLDVGCGEGQLTQQAAQRGLEAYGVDFAGAALRRARLGHAGLELAAADGEALPFSNATFDYVACIGSLEHYLQPGRGASEMARVLRTDGLAAVLLPNTFGLRWSVLYAWRHGDVHDDGQPLQRFGTRRQWVRLLTAGGLVVEKAVSYEATLVGLRDWVTLVPHPSRVLVPLGRWLPVDLASMFVFLCRKAPPGD